MNYYENQLADLLKFDLTWIIDQNRKKFDNAARNFAESIVLVGAGQLGVNTLAGLLQLGIDPLAFADNNPDLWGKEINGLKVLSISEAVRRFSKKAVFVTTIYNGSVVRRQLRDLDCQMVVPFSYLYWKYANTFLPHCSLDLPNEIYIQSEDVRKALSLWADDFSRHEFLSQIKWRLLLDSDSMSLPLPMGQIYFPPDLINVSSSEIYVDCGAFDGTNIASFIQYAGKDFRQAIALEPDPTSFKELQKYLSTLPESLKNKVVAFQMAVGKNSGTVHFENMGTVISRIAESGQIEVAATSLDEIISEYSTAYVKMDIEGSELDALAGAYDTIKRANTVWAVCAYHKQEDMWKIPLFIRSISDDYLFYLRRYAEECWELVCYAIPKKKLL
ncbi:MAG: FkbM family methyltransferase [Syntrophales bacterium]|nr:FkbM family methyltransferase [Syntrophales bacterium]